MELKYAGVATLARQNKGDAGLDLPYDPYAERTLVLRRGERCKAPTGLRVAIPEGHAGLVLPRSGLALMEGVTVFNSPGLIDSGYRGEVCVLLVNLGDHAVAIRPGERIAQLVVIRLAEVEPVQVDELEETERGEGGFGSTGS